ncbi:NAD(P)-dependent oxidoreductase [Bacillus carboniphilus]|uniref:precorrin-2 dehydrogenase n=1 Tax=Bacillus carboniphilus TaxID=86663 RepID=A0ABY9JW08_9BACI|nr:NAD(P)-dependent oxidoreductase [Bacillus carboniphilus]WLR43586.1 NAD(P)-dependent oxidoreductase [Bacillus carboniphilus]
MISIVLSLKDKKVVVVGGGAIAERKIKNMLAEEALITVVSPMITEEIQKWKDKKKLTWHQKYFQKRDLEGAFLVIAATDQENVNKQIADQCTPNQLVNVVSYYEQGNVIFPASASKENILVSVCSFGADPKWAKKMCNDTIKRLSEEEIEALSKKHQVRKRMLISSSQTKIPVDPK